MVAGRSSGPKVLSGAQYPPLTPPILKTNTWPQNEHLAEINPGRIKDCSGLFESDHGISLGPCEFEKGVQELDVAGPLGNGPTGEHAELCRLHDRGR